MIELVPKDEWGPKCRYCGTRLASAGSRHTHENEIHRGRPRYSRRRAGVRA